MSSFASVSGPITNWADELQYLDFRLSKSNLDHDFWSSLTILYTFDSLASMIACLSISRFMLARAHYLSIFMLCC